MIEIVQAGQAGKTRLLFDMHRLRKRVFADRLQWSVKVNEGGLEVDQFDLPQTVYMLSINDDGRVIGNWRLLPTTGPTMIRDIWPQFLDDLDMPIDPFVWEASRFAVDSDHTDKKEGLRQVQGATSELFCALTELCLMCGIHRIYTLYDLRVARLLHRVDCVPEYTTPPRNVDGYVTQVGVFRTDESMLERLQKRAGIHHPLINTSDLPPVIQAFVRTRNRTALKEREVVYAYR